MSDRAEQDDDAETVRLLFEAFVDGDDPPWLGVTASLRDGDDYSQSALTEQWYAFRAGYEAGRGR